jgi:hypothetical protein
MYLAKRTAQKFGKPFIVVRNCGPAKLAAMLESFDRSGRPELLAAAGM